MSFNTMAAARQKLMNERATLLTRTRLTLRCWPLSGNITTLNSDASTDRMGETSHPGVPRCCYRGRQTLGEVVGGSRQSAVFWAGFDAILMRFAGIFTPP